tara:strand:+ start:171 stop:1253 length:1083 start_codon:yes stop_codon:yes gene_type:complete
MKKYDGLTNIWLNIKDLSRYPKIQDHFKAVDHLRCKSGYCLISRSFIHQKVNINDCIDLDLKKITFENLHLLNINEIVLCKLPHWDNYVPGKIIKIHDKNEYGDEEEWSFGEKKNTIISFGEGVFDIIFASCPDSDIYLTWHNNNTILQSRSVLTYKNTSFQKYQRFYKSKTMEQLNKYDAPFIIDDIGDTIRNIVNELIDNVIENVRPKSIIHSGLFDKCDTIKNEILRYNVYWLRISSKNFNCSTDSNIFTISSKSLNISHNTTSGTFLSNVSILYPNAIDDILKIQCFNNCGLKMIHKEMYNLKQKQYFLEPQKLSFLNKLPQRIYLFDENMLYTYTGKLCNSAKKFLFSANKIDIK